MIDYSNYIYNDGDTVFFKQNQNERYEKQLGDFGEQLVMTMLGRLSGFSVALVDHEGADLIASDKKGNEYAISVKARQFGPIENETYVFDNENCEKLCCFANDFDLIPAVALVLIPRDFAYIDLYLLTLKGFIELSNRNDSNIEENAIKKVKKGLQINNYSLGVSGKKTPFHYDKYGYLKYLHNSDIINHVRLDVRGKKNFKKELSQSERVKMNLKGSSDGNLKRQLGDCGEILVTSLLGQLKKYKVARVDHVGADIIATDYKGNKYAISVKTTKDSKYDFYELYTSNTLKNPKKEISKLLDFSKKYKNMTPVIACVFIKGNFESVDIYIATLDCWLDVSTNNNIKSVKYKPLLGENIDRDNWDQNLSVLSVNINDIKKKKILDMEDRIEHMQMQSNILLSVDKRWI